MKEILSPSILPSSMPRLAPRKLAVPKSFAPSGWNKNSFVIFIARVVFDFPRPSAGDGAGRRRRPLSFLIPCSLSWRHCHQIANVTSNKMTGTFHHKRRSSFLRSAALGSPTSPVRAFHESWDFLQEFAPGRPHRAETPGHSGSKRFAARAVSNRRAILPPWVFVRRRRGRESRARRVVAQAKPPNRQNR